MMSVIVDYTLYTPDGEFPNVFKRWVDRELLDTPEHIMEFLVKYSEQIYKRSLGLHKVNRLNLPTPAFHRWGVLLGAPINISTMKVLNDEFTLDSLSLKIYNIPKLIGVGELFQDSPGIFTSTGELVYPNSIIILLGIR